MIYINKSDGFQKCFVQTVLVIESIVESWTGHMADILRINILTPFHPPQLTAINLNTGQT